MVAGLPAEYIKRHNGNMKAAWADYRAQRGGKKPTHHRSTTVREVTDQKSPGLRATVQFQTQKQVDPVAIGYLLYGLLTEAQSPTTGELQKYFPPGSTGDPVVADANVSIWRQGDDEREIGREMARALGFGITELRITQQQWSAMYPRALAIIAGNGNARPSQGFLPPLADPTVITSAFGPRQASPGVSAYHTGLDLSAALGTSVHAPWASKILYVGEDAGGGGTIVTLGIQRPDGSYSGDSSIGNITENRDGLLVTFAHLSAALVGVGQEVNAGDVVAASGASGTAIQRDAQGNPIPHLHVSVQLFTDAPLLSTDVNGREYLDPAGVWGGNEEITGLATGGPAPGEVISGVDVNRVTGAQAPFAIAVNQGGTVNVVGNNGNIVNTNTKITFPLGSFGGSGDAAGYEPAPLAVQQQAQSQGIDPSSILRGVGSLAGQFFTEVGTAAGPVLAVIRQAIPVGAQVASAAAALFGQYGGPALQLAGGAASVAAPFLAFVPEVGSVLSLIASAAGTGLSVAGAAIPVANPVVTPVVTAGISGASSAAQVLFGGIPPSGNDIIAQPLAPQPSNVYAGPQQ